MAKDTIKRQRVSVKGGVRLPMRGSLDKAVGGFTAPASPRKHNLQVRHRLVHRVSCIRAVQRPSCGSSRLWPLPTLLTIGPPGSPAALIVHALAGNLLAYHILSARLLCSP